MAGPRSARVDEYKKKRIAKLLADGLSYTDIGKSLNINHTTVRNVAIQMGIAVVFRRRAPK